MGERKCKTENFKAELLSNAEKYREKEILFFITSSSFFSINTVHSPMNHPGKKIAAGLRKYQTGKSGTKKLKKEILASFPEGGKLMDVKIFSAFKLSYVLI